MGHESRHDIDIIPIPNGSNLAQHTLANIDFSAARLILFGVLIQPHSHKQAGFALSNMEFRFNPTPQFGIKPGDILVVLGHSESIQQFCDGIESNTLSIANTNTVSPA